MNSLHPQPKPTDFSSSPLSEHLPHLFFPTTCSIVAQEAVPVTNNLPMRGCEHFCQTAEREAGTCQKRRQVSVEHLLRQKKTAVSICHHCSLPIRRPVKHFESDGLVKRAGDGTRTRDSLLGRQMVAGSPPASYKMPPGERSYIFTVIHAHLKQIVARILRQMVMDHMHWKEYTLHLLERQERQMVNHLGNTVPAFSHTL